MTFFQKLNEMFSVSSAPEWPEDCDAIEVYEVSPDDLIRNLKLEEVEDNYIDEYSEVPEDINHPAYQRFLGWDSIPD